MDHDRFDAVTRFLATARSRRRALAAVLGTPLGMASVHEAAAKKKCPPCKKLKQGKCKKKLPNGTGCPGGTCQSGSCVASSGASGAPPRCANLGEACLLSNPAGAGCCAPHFCGFRETTAGRQYSCRRSTCVAANEACADDQDCCLGVCDLDKVCRSQARTCAEWCPATCEECYYRATGGPPICGNEGGSLCDTPCSSNSDCRVGSDRDCITHRVERDSGDSRAMCPGANAGCTAILGGNCATEL